MTPAPIRSGRPLHAGSLVGRYVLQEQLGAGGHGAVYAAFDPGLERRVALKLLHVEASARSRAGQKLLREGQAVAQLSHRNAVAIHDVGTHHGDVFIAMELIDGDTLGDWLDGRRTLAEILDAFVQAARGLSAAHAKGIVHRDFKPANVFVERGGRVVVGDFGLARAVDGADASSDAGERDSDPVWRASMTRTGAVVGTPAYMAPEQWGGAADARSDQFSFCVALYEAIYGRRPNDGDREDSLLAALRSLRLERVSPRGRVPSWLRELLARGLRAEPAERFDDVDELVRVLDRGRRRPRRRLVATLVAGAIVAATAVGYATATHDQPNACPAAARSLAGVWDDDARGRVDAAFSATGDLYADEAAARTKQGLDAYARGWRDEHRAACEATHVRKEQSAELLDLRMTCLQERKADFAALVRELAHMRPDSDAIEMATAVAQLAPPTSCRNRDRLSARYKHDPTLRARAADLRADLATARAFAATGQYAKARDTADAVADAARGAKLDALVAQALVVAGDARAELLELEDAEAMLTQAADLAAAVGDESLAATAWLGAIMIIGAGEDQLDRAFTLLPVVRTLVMANRDDTQLQVRFHSAAADLYHLRGDSARAGEELERAAALEGDDTTDPARAAAALARWGDHQLLQRDYAAARTTLERALAASERAYGPRHPRLITLLNSLGYVAVEQKRLTDALAIRQRALAVSQAAYPADHPHVGTARLYVGQALTELGRYEEAFEHLEAALHSFEVGRGPEHVSVFYAALYLGNASVAVGRYESARSYYERARHLIEKNPRRAYMAGVVWASLGETSIELGDNERAEAECETARRLADSAGGPRSFIAYPLHCLGSAALALGRAQRAIPLLEQALELREADATAFERADTQFALARALWQGGGDRERALVLTRAAAAALGDVDQVTAQVRDRRARVSAWLESHLAPTPVTR